MRHPSFPAVTSYVIPGFSMRPAHRLLYRMLPPPGTLLHLSLATASCHPSFFDSPIHGCPLQSSSLSPPATNSRRKRTRRFPFASKGTSSSSWSCSPSSNIAAPAALPVPPASPSSFTAAFLASYRRDLLVPSGQARLLHVLSSSHPFSSPSSRTNCISTGITSTDRTSQTRISSLGNSMFSSSSPIVVPPSPPPLNKDSVGVIPTPPPSRTTEHFWTDEAWAPASSLDVRRRIYCNRSLNMKTITAVGFDMDYTLAQYNSETFEALAHRFTTEKLVGLFGYPEVVKDFVFDWKYMMRGLIIDKKRGNIIKVDRHKYVKLAYHGFAELSREERMNTYARSQLREAFDEPDFGMIDTLFSLAEAHLFMNLVQLKDANPGLMAHKSYEEMYKDVRASVDYSHRDGSLKKAVAADPAKYIHRDPCLVDVLATIRRSGKKVFLATNSLWDYTDVVMNFILEGRCGKEHRSRDWLSHFDAVFTGCGKPEFFNSNRPLFQVDMNTGFLVNTDNGAPIIPIGEEDMSQVPNWQSRNLPSSNVGGIQTNVFQGGTYGHLHKVLGVGSGMEVLYVGDHIYGDILRSKKTLGWRTMLVVPELENELHVLSRCHEDYSTLRDLRSSRDALDDQIQRLEWGMRGAASSNGASPAGDQSPAHISDTSGTLASLRTQREEVRQLHRQRLLNHHQLFHPVWGRLLKTGYQNSLLAHQIERFACLYTSHVSNLLFYSPLKSHRGRVDYMAHEEDPALALTFDQNGTPEGDIGGLRRNGRG